MKSNISLLVIALSIGFVLAAPLDENKDEGVLYIKSNDKFYDLNEPVIKMAINQMFELWTEQFTKTLKAGAERLLTDFGDLTVVQIMQKLNFDFVNMMSKDEKPYFWDENKNYEVLLNYAKDRKHPNKDDYRTSGQFSYVFGDPNNKETMKIIEKIKKVIKYNQDLEQSEYDKKLGEAPVQNFDFLNKMAEVDLN